MTIHATGRYNKGILCVRGCNIVQYCGENDVEATIILFTHLFFLEFCHVQRFGANPRVESQNNERDIYALTLQLLLWVVVCLDGPYGSK